MPDYTDGSKKDVVEIKFLGCFYFFYYM